MQDEEQKPLSPEAARVLRRIFVWAVVAMVAVGVGAYFIGSWAALAPVVIWGGFLAFSVRKIMRLYSEEPAPSGAARELPGPAAVHPGASVHERVIAGLLFLGFFGVAIWLFAEGHQLYAQVPVLLAMISLGGYLKWTRRRAE